MTNTFNSRLLLREFTCLMAVMILWNCASRRNEWSDIDYSRLRSYESRQNDASYTAPSVINCVDDDLYNCNPR